MRRTGPYRITRNPQIPGGYLLVIGCFLQWPTLYAVGWTALYGVLAHWLIIAEEEHLGQAFGRIHERYCWKVPRHLLKPAKR